MLVRDTTISLTGCGSPRWLSLAISTWARPASSTGAPAGHASWHWLSRLSLGGPVNIVIVKTVWLLGTTAQSGYEASGSGRSGGGVQRPRTLAFMTPSPRTMGSDFTSPDLCLPGCRSPSSPTQFSMTALSVFSVSLWTIIISLYSLWVAILLPADLYCHEQSFYT